jgi:hypothetical protein
MADFHSTGAPPAGDDPADRRRHARIKVPLKARFLTEDGEERPCLVANISAGGALLKAKVVPKEGDYVVLYIDDVGRFEGKVVRSGEHVFAVDYRGRKSKSKRTADALTAAAATRGSRIDRRAAPRIKQDSPAIVTLETGETLSCSILDISLTGASIEIEPRPPLGMQLTLGRMSAKVVRRHEKGVGVVFSGPARRMEDAIGAATVALEDEDGAEIARAFGRKGLTA